MANVSNTARRDLELRGMIPADHPFLDGCNGLPPRLIFQKLLTAGAEKEALSQICQSAAVDHPLGHSLRAMGGIEAMHFLLNLTRYIPFHGTTGAMPIMPTHHATGLVTPVAPTVLATPVSSHAEPLQTSTLLDDDELSSLLSLNS